MNFWLKTLKIRHLYKKSVFGVTRKIFGYSSAALAIARCHGIAEISSLKEENLSREQCIKQACLLSVNSASTLLTTTSSILLEVCNHYKDTLNRILSLLEEIQIIEGENPQLWDAVVEARAEVIKAKAAVTELNSYMDSVEKVVTSTTEAAFLAGAEYMCTTLCERLDYAQREIKNQIANLKKLEEEYLKVQQEIVKKKQKEDPKNKHS